MTVRGAGNILGITQVKTLTAKIPRGLETRLRLLARKRQETVRKALDREVQGDLRFAELAQEYCGMFAGPRNLSSRRGYGTVRAR